MRISDWSSDVCSADLCAIRPIGYEYDFETGQNLFDTYYVNNSGGLTSGRQPTDSFPPNIYSDLSSFIPGGVFSGKSSSRDRFRSEERRVGKGCVGRCRSRWSP